MGQLSGMGAEQEPEQSGGRPAAAVADAASPFSHRDFIGGSRVRPHRIGPALPELGLPLRDSHSAGGMDRDRRIPWKSGPLSGEKRDPENPPLSPVSAEEPRRA